MNHLDFISCLLEDKSFVEIYCGKYKVKVVEIFPNSEDSPPQGLIYVFDNQLGGYSIEGIKNSLEDKIEGD